MKNEAEKAVEKEMSVVESEQGYADTTGKSVDPNKNFGHASAASAGIAGQIPGEV